MLVNNNQPFSFVDYQSLKECVVKLDPMYTLPSRQALKNMVEEKYEEEKTKTQLQRVEGVSLPCDMWTSRNMDTYFAVTCHHVDENAKLASVLLGVLPLHQDHTTENIAAAKRSLMVECGTEGEIICLVTDAATNMTVTARNLVIRHVVCIAYALNLIVKNPEIKLLAKANCTQRHGKW